MLQLEKRLYTDVHFASFLCRKGSNKCARLETGNSYLCAMYSCIHYHQYICNLKFAKKKEFLPKGHEILDQCA